MTEESHDADYIFLTHDHYDHYSLGDIAKVIGEHTTIIAPDKMADTVANEVAGYEDVVAVGVGISKSVNGLEFETVASYNQLKPFHPKSSGWVGYIVCVDGRCIYVAGDTDATKEARQVKCDIALVPIGGTYTMDAKKAAELINAIKPQIAIPTHYGSAVSKPADADTFEKNVKEPVKVVKKIRF
jgi:L-ascorbate metabolism protein UlaG (beta-lactamase superfamily)